MMENIINSTGPLTRGRAKGMQQSEVAAKYTGGFHPDVGILPVTPKATIDHGALNS
jgi:hypothetical protein